LVESWSDNVVSIAAASNWMSTARPKKVTGHNDSGGKVMSQRESGYERIERDCYETPDWARRISNLLLPPPLRCGPVRTQQLMIKFANGLDRLLQVLCVPKTLSEFDGVMESPKLAE